MGAKWGWEAGKRTFLPWRKYMVSRKQDILKSEKEAFARSSKEAGKAVASILGRAD